MAGIGSGPEGGFGRGLELALCGVRRGGISVPSPAARQPVGGQHRARGHTTSREDSRSFDLRTVVLGVCAFSRRWRAPDVDFAGIESATFARCERMLPCAALATAGALMPDWIASDSSLVARYAYDAQLLRLYVTFREPVTEGFYADVPTEVYQQFLAASSQGAFLVRHLRNNLAHPWTRINASP
jgi:hypothetical protein